MESFEKKMDGAKKLVVLLMGEGVRWNETVATISFEIEQVVVNVFLSCS